MSELIKFSDVRDRVVRLRDQDVLLDADVAQLYGVETKEVNKAVRNNPDKFPDGYIFELQQSEKQYVVENFHTLSGSNFPRLHRRHSLKKGSTCWLQF